MKSHHLPRRLPPMRTLALAAVCTLLGPAWAAPVAVDAGTSAGVASGAGTPSTSSWGGPPAYTNSSTSASDDTGYASSHAFANSNGAYAVSSQVGGIGDATARSSIRYALTNTAAVAMQYTMSFYIYGGYISSQLHNNYYNGSGPVLTGDESLFASYGARIAVDGNTRFATGATVQQDANGNSWSKTGTDLNGGDDGSDGYYEWGGATYNIDLGIIAAGATVDILAELDDMVIADVGSYDYSCGEGYGYGYGYGYGGPITCNAFKGTAQAFYGDPFNFQGTPPEAVTFTASAVNAVPEPAGLALVGLALAAAASTTRRRRHGVMADASEGPPPR